MLADIKMRIEVDDADACRWLPEVVRKTAVTRIGNLMSATEANDGVSGFKQRRHACGECHLCCLKVAIDAGNIAGIVQMRLPVQDGKIAHRRAQCGWPLSRARPTMVSAHAFVGGETEECHAWRGVGPCRDDDLVPTPRIGDAWRIYASEPDIAHVASIRS